jgi:predicted N-acyltransferase
MIEYRVTDTINVFTRDQWDALFPGELERYDYLAATEAAGLQGFQWRYVIAEDRGQLLAAVPAFLTDYALDTTLTGIARRLVTQLRRQFPRALVLRLACLGSPCTETISVGFTKEVDAKRHASILSGLLQVFERHACASRCNLLAVKDVPAEQSELWRRAAGSASYQTMPSLPGTVLELRFASTDDYMAQLTQGTRRDMRRKLRSRSEVRIEHRRNIDDVIAPIGQLYAATRARARLSFEELTPAFFQGVLARVPGASCTLYFVGDELLAMNLLLEDQVTLLDKFFCMSDSGRDYNLYFLSWFCNVEYCLSKGLRRYLSGQAGYTNKLRLGSTLNGTSMYFRHRNVLLNVLLRMVARRFTRSLDPSSA